LWRITILLNGRPLFFRSKLESSGLTLSKIEQSGLLSNAEKSGVLSLIADKCARTRAGRTRGSKPINEQGSAFVLTIYSDHTRMHVHPPIVQVVEHGERMNDNCGTIIRMRAALPLTRGTQLAHIPSLGTALIPLIEKALHSRPQSNVPCSALHRNTPGLLSTTGLVAAAAAAALVYAVPDDSTALIAAQATGAAVLGGAAIAAFVGSSLLGSLQKV
jgi:Protein of unknown function (DUF1118)